jgi:serine/threonine protein kinase
MPDTTSIASVPPITSGASSSNSNCPRCGVGLKNLPTDADAKCPTCGLDLFFTQSTDDTAAFSGWLPRKIGPFDISAFVAEGETGIVLRAAHREKQTPSAITLLRLNSDAREQFLAQVETLKKLKHPNVLTPLDQGEEQEMLWLAVDWFEGQSLATRIAKANEKDEQIDLVEIQETMQRVRDGLEYLHTNGVVHRELKPANVLVGRDRAVKIVAIGITNSSGGAYVAPEQLEGKPTSTSSDVYCLGLIWYEMLTGKPRTAPAQPPVQVRPETPTAWNNAITKCFVPIAPNRIRLNNLKSILSERPRATGRRKSTPARTTPKQTKQANPATPPKPATAGSGLWKLAAALGAIWLVVFGIWRGRALLHHSHEQTQAAKTAPATAPTEQPVAQSTQQPTVDEKPAPEAKAPVAAKPEANAKTALKDLSIDDVLAKAKAEDVEAMAELGQRYQHGTSGARQNSELALKWWRAAATRGHFPAMLLLANAQRDVAENESLESSEREPAAREANLWYTKLTSTTGVALPQYLAALMAGKELQKHFPPTVFTAETTADTRDTTGDNER